MKFLIKPQKDSNYSYDGNIEDTLWETNGTGNLTTISITINGRVFEFDADYIIDICNITKRLQANS